MAKKTRSIIIDTYALIADLVGEIPLKARRILDQVRIGEVRGLIHDLIIYELSYHWRKGRLPFKDEEELIEFIATYFSTVDLTIEDLVKASYIKIVGDNILREASEPLLKRRKLSISDALCIVLALKYKVPIVTGDKDLSYVARHLEVETIW